MIYKYFGNILELLALMKQLLINQIYSMFLYKEDAFRISIQDGIKLFYLQVKYPKKCPGE